MINFMFFISGILIGGIISIFLICAIIVGAEADRKLIDKEDK